MEDGPVRRRRCPKCSSVDVEYVVKTGHSVYYHCAVCGQIWREERHPVVPKRRRTDR